MWGHIFNLENPLIGAENTWMLWAICVLGAAAAIYLEQTYQWAAKMSGAIIALIFAIILSNFGIIPMSCSVWDVVSSYIVPLSIPLLLLQCDMRKIGKEAGRILVIFLIGSIGTTCGALLAYFIFKDMIPELGGLAAMFTGTYTGGTVNFVALKDEFGVSETMTSAAIVADNLLMVLYFFVLIAMPTIGFFRKKFTHPHVDEMEKNPAGEGKTEAAAFWARKEISLKDIAFGLATSFVIVAVSTVVSGALAGVIPTSNAFMQIINTLLGSKWLWITTLSMCCATFAPGFFGEIKGSQELGTFGIYLFFFSMGVPASIMMIIKNSPLLLVVAAIVVGMNMIFSIVGGLLLKFDLEDVIIASNANVGGPTTAAAMAVSKGWSKLIGPALLIGTFGYVLGTYLGLIVGSVLGL